MQKKEIIYVITLCVIKYNRDISELFAYGVSIPQIPIILKHLEVNGYLMRRGGEYILTVKGESFIESADFHFTHKVNRVTPKFDQRIPRIELEDIYLPQKPPNL